MNTQPVTTNEVNRVIEALESQGAINVELLTRATAYIESHPDEFDMNEWRNPDGRTFWQKLAMKPAFTIGCFACHVVRLAGEDAANSPVRAQQLLGLTDEQSESLFYVQSWPEPYRTRFYSIGEGDTTGLAWVAGQRFRKFIASNGAV